MLFRSEIMDQNMYEVDVYLLEKKGGFLNELPEWINLKIIDDYQYIASWIMDAPWLVVKKLIFNYKFIIAFELAFTQVHENLRRQGIGHRLMAVAKEQAVRERRRAMILETQSCNTAAIRFYEKEGFELIGFDTCCYSNRDRERKEVRINMGYFLKAED